jgi:hypothetical protein
MMWINDLGQIITNYINPDDATNLTLDNKHAELVYLGYIHMLSFKLIMYRNWQEMEPELWRQRNENI